VILPSEYTRDSKEDWDSFEVVGGYLQPITDEDPGPLWISTENYKHRRKGLLAPNEPSPDWQFDAVDNDTANVRLKVIAEAFKSASEGVDEIAMAPASAPGVKVPPRRDAEPASEAK
jgi:hypothetical protein